MVMKFQLVYPPQELREITSEGWSRPHGILTLATYLEHKELADVEVIDGTLSSIEAALERIKGDGDVVGLSINVANYRNALTIAREVKARNSEVEVYFGGPNATALSDNIVKNRGSFSGDYCVDGVVVRDGHAAIEAIAQGRKKEEVPNLVYLSNGKICHNPFVETDWSTIPKENWELVRGDLEKGFGVYQKKFAGITPFSKATSIISQYGCASAWCKFCGRMNRKSYEREPNAVWEEITELQEKYGVDFVFDVSDSFTQNPDYVKRFASAKPNNIRVKFRFFVRSDHIDSEIVEQLKQIGVYEVYVGIESGSQKMLDRMNKKTTPDINLNAVKILSEEGIRLCTSYVLATPGENQATLEDTIKHAEEIYKISKGGVNLILSSVLNPLPGSPFFADLQRVGTTYDYKKEDLFYLPILQEDWIKHFCPEISMDDLHRTIQRLIQFGKKYDVKGIENERSRCH